MLSVCLVLVRSMCLMRSMCLVCLVCKGTHEKEGISINQSGYVKASVDAEVRNLLGCGNARDL